MSLKKGAKLCLGGSFNPIHHGHLICARAAAEALGAAGVCLIPAGQPPHKPAQAPQRGSEIGAMAAVADRLEMCRLAIAGIAGFELDDRETRRSGPSYTIQSVRELRAQGFEQVAWLIGADMLPGLPGWHQAPALLSEAMIYVMARPGWTMDWSTLGPDWANLRQRVLTVPPIDISSTDIRRRVREGRGIEFLTPPAVCRYIHEHKLYRS